MRSVAKSRMFFEELIVRKKMPLTEVMEFFKKKNGKFDPEPAWQFILEIHNGKALCVLDVEEKEWAFSKELLAHPGSYTLVVKDMAALDSRVTGGYLTLASPGFSMEDSPPESHYALQFVPLFRVVGDKEGAEALTEKVRAFTHFFAFQLSARKLSFAASFFSEVIRDQNTESILSQKLSELEAIYGPFAYFDRVTTYTVYHGKGRDKTLFREMELPKGVHRDQRRGEAEFHLVGMHTPSGALIDSVRVSLGVIEEHGVLKIADIKWYAE